MEFNTVIKNRCSIRKFTDEAVSKEIINEILEVGRIAPSAGNQQPTVVSILNESDIKKLENYPEAKIHPVLFRTKQALLICYDKTLEMKRPHDNFTFGLVDSSITTTYMMLKMTELGLGSTWIGWFNPTLLREILQLPNHLEISSILAFGYPQENFKASKLHNERKDMKEFILKIE